jgi:hypothetical protein
MSKNDTYYDSFVKGSPSKKLSLVWDLTKELLSLKGKNMLNKDYKEILQNLLKNKKSTGREKDKLDIKYLKKKY